MNLSLERGPPEAGKAIPERACVPWAHSNPTPRTMDTKRAVGFADSPLALFVLARGTTIAG